jgi:hypothetical protein
MRVPFVFWTCQVGPFNSSDRLPLSYQVAGITRIQPKVYSSIILVKLKKAQVQNLRLKRICADLFEHLRSRQYSQCSGPGNGLRPAANVELAVDVVGMYLDGTQREEELLSDFAVGQSFGDESQDLQFTLG